MRDRMTTIDSLTILDYLKCTAGDYDQSVTHTYQNTVQERKEPYKRAAKTITNKKHLIIFRLTYKKREIMM